MTNYLRRLPQPIFMGEPSPPASIIDVSNSSTLFHDLRTLTSAVQEHMAQVQPGTIISGAPPRPRNRISYALSAYSRYNEFFGTGAHLWPISLISSARYLPPTIIIHGDQDTAVNIEDTKAFVKKAKELLGGDSDGADVRLIVREGMDHGFDMDAREDEEWVKDVVKWIEERWLG